MDSTQCAADARARIQEPTYSAWPAESELKGHGEYIKVEVDWEDIKQKKFEKALRRGYADDLLNSVQLLARQDIGGFIDEIESIPGADDLSVEAWGNGQNLSFG